MLSPSECLLKADNYVIAARMAAPEERMELLAEAAHWRRVAFRLQMERFGPFADSGEAGPRDRGPAGPAD